MIVWKVANQITSIQYFECKATLWEQNVGYESLVESILLVKLFQIIAITLHNSEIKILKDYNCS